MKYNIIVSLLLLSTVTIRAQISMPNTAWSFEENVEDAMVYELPSFDNEEMNAKHNGEHGLPDEFFYAEEIKVDIKPSKNGTWSTLEDGRKIWRVKIYSPTAYGFHIGSKNYKLPEGANLYFYNEDKSNVYGAYSEHNNKESGSFSSSAIYENPIIVELNIPKEIEAKDWNFEINSLGYIFTDATEIGQASECQTDVACQPWWTEWCNEIRSVVKLQVRTERAWYTTPNDIEGPAFWSSSTGVILNDAPHPQDFQDLKILTAAHSISDKKDNFYYYYRIEPETWIVYYNFQYPNCGNISNLGNDKMTTTGIERLFSTEDEFTVINTTEPCPDIALIKITDDIPFQYNLYYAGWSLADEEEELTSLNTTFIHHPRGDLKKMGEGEIQIRNNEQDETCWEITNNTVGAPEWGSSGCPYFTNEEHHIIGIQSQWKRKTPFCIEGQGKPSLVGKINAAAHLGLMPYLGLIPMVSNDGADPFEACLDEMNISGLLFPGADWQAKNDLVIQANNIISPRANSGLETMITQSPNPPTIYSDYTFRATTKVTLQARFSVKRGNKFKAKIGACQAFEGCGFNVAARPVQEVDENSFFETAAAQKQGELFIQPNPSNGRIQVALPKEGGFLRLYNANGQLIWQQGNCNQRLALDFSQFQAGFYLLQWQNEEEVQSKKLILR